uniref:Uncharacterized protein n=1 Tax=Rhizophora mucronata TaxID=61149 RepID=A0A2P2NVD8_RHIMU
MDKFILILKMWRNCLAHFTTFLVLGHTHKWKDRT